MSHLFLSPLYRCVLLACAALFVSTNALYAQPGTRDPSFNQATVIENNFAAQITALVLQPDGKVLIGGTFGQCNGVNRVGMARLNTDGTLDNLFIPSKAGSNTVNSLALQPDGKIIVGGTSIPIGPAGGPDINRIYRLNADGSMDNSFNGTINHYVHAIVLQPDGKVIIGGSFYGASQNRIARLNADGSLDNTFTSGFGTATVYALALQPDGKVIIGSSIGLARLNVDGSLDTAFNPGSGTNGSVRALALQPDGKVIIVGTFTQYNGVNRIGLARLNTDGSLDNTFTSGFGTGTIYAIALQPDGKVIIGGSFLEYNGVNYIRTARLNTDGTLDNIFTPRILGGGYVNALALQADGKVIVGEGNAGRYTNYIVRILGCAAITVASTPLPNGTVSTTYSQTLSASGGSAPYKYTLSSGSLPTGVTLSESGVLSGTPTVAGTFTFTVKATDVNGCSGEAIQTLTVELNPDDLFAYKVKAFTQGKTKQGSTIEAIRNNPQQALGAPQDNDTYNFVSLGFGGSITLELAKPLYDTNGYKPDFILVETSFGRADQKCYGNDGSINYPETALIQVSADNQKWVSLPDAYCRTSFIDISPAIKEGLPFVQYIRIKDASNKDLFPALADGFDVDGIIVGPDAVAQGLKDYTNARVTGGSLWNGAFYNHAPNEAAEDNQPLRIYPNPVSGQSLSGSLTVEYVSGTHQPLEISVYNAAGVQVRSVAESATEGTNVYILNVSALAKGLYLIKVRTARNQPIATKFIKQ